MAHLLSPQGYEITIIANDNGVTSLTWEKCDAADHPIALRAAKELEAYFKGELEAFTVPFDFSSGTDFQQRVWQALLDIPYAKTVTYNDIAKQIGSAPRAVGGAVGANPIPILVPCHRVMGAGNKLTGYSGKGGLKTKQELLKLEGVAT